MRRANPSTSSGTNRHKGRTRNKVEKTTMKKVLLGLGAAGITLAMIPLFAAFEAHVVNVTARIENALEVPLSHIDFGTVFPQELLFRELPVRLSGSFMTEDRVDDVE